MLKPLLLLLICACASADTELEETKGVREIDQHAANDMQHLIERLSNKVDALGVQVSTLATSFAVASTNLQLQIYEETKRTAEVKSSLESSIYEVKNTLQKEIEKHSDALRNQVIALSTNVSISSAHLQRQINGEVKRVSDVKSKLEGSIDSVKCKLENDIKENSNALRVQLNSLTTNVSISSTDLQKHIKDELKVIAGVKSKLESSIGTVKSKLESSMRTVKNKLESSIGTVKSNLEGSISTVKSNLETEIKLTSDGVNALAHLKFEVLGYPRRIQALYRYMTSLHQCFTWCTEIRKKKGNKWNGVMYREDVLQCECYRETSGPFIEHDGYLYYSFL